MRVRCVIALMVLALIVLASTAGAQSPDALDERVVRLLSDNRFADAEQLVRAEQKTLEARGEGDSLKAAVVLDILWNVLAHRGLAQGDEATALARKSLDIRERLAGPDAAVLTVSLNALATSLSQNPSAARPLLERALAIQQKTLGREHSGTASTLLNLSVVLYRLHELPGAIRMGEEALAIFEKLDGPDHVDVANTLNSLAAYYSRAGELQKSRLANERALAIWKLRYGPEHLRAAAQLSNLAGLYVKQKDYAGALSLEREALAIRVKALGPDHPNVANGKNNLADTLVRLNDFAEARKYAEESLALREKIFGTQQPEYTQTLAMLSKALSGLGEHAEAAAAAVRAEQSERAWRRLNLQTLSADESEQFAQGGDTSIAAGMWVASNAASHPDIVRAIWNEVISSRALAFDELAQRRKTEDSAMQAAVSAARRRYVSLLVKGRSDALAAARDEMDAAERDLASRSTQFRTEQSRARVGFAEVAQALPARSALVAYGIAEDAQDNLHYVAFVLADGAASPRLIPIGTKQAVESAIAKWRAEIQREAESAGHSERRNEAAIRTPGDALRRMVWDSVAVHLTSARRVFIVPDGALSLIDFAALPAPDGKYLVETGATLHILSAEKDLVQPPVQTSGLGLLAIGNPAFEAQATRRAARRSTPQNLHFAPLPASAIEVKELATLWSASHSGGSADLLTGDQASEDNLRRMAPGKGIVHFATHGFFFQSAVKTPTDPPFSISGLALAGANRQAGVLTAEEASTLNLDGVEWVVLSGCDTGLGSIANGEGVFGLRRAFQVAGASTVIMSLWQVDDAGTREWMRDLYLARFERKLGTAESVRAAMIRVLQQRRAKGESTHPFYWAAFVATGDWR